MRKLTQVATALLAVLAFTALVTSPATAAPEVLKFAGNVGESKGGKIELTALGAGLTIICQKYTNLKVEFLTATTGQIGDIHFEECTALGEFAANSLGDASGVVLTGTVSFKLCTANEKPLEVGIELTLTKEAHVEVPIAGALLNLKGTFSGILTPINRASRDFDIAFTKSGAGDQSAGKCVTTILASKDEKHVVFVSAAFAGLDTLTFPKEFEIMG